MSEGHSFEGACGGLGISKQSGYNFLEKHQEFLDAKNIGEAKNQFYLEKLALDSIIMTGENVKFNATPWVMMMANMHNWHRTDNSRDTDTGQKEITIKFDPKAIK